jgi:glutaredoxin
MDFNKDSSTNNNEYDSSQQSQNIVIPSYEECRSLYIMGMALLNDIHNVVITEQSPDFTNILNDNGSHSIISLNRPLWTTSKIFTVINNIAMSALHISEIYINSQLYDTITNDNNSSDNTNTSQNILNQFQFKICFNCNNYVEISVKINEPSICTYCKFANDICARSLIPLTIHSVISQNTSSNLIDTIRPVKSCMLCKTYYQVDTFLVNDEELGVRNSVAFEWMLNESYCGFAMCMYCSISLSYS